MSAFDSGMFHTDEYVHALRLLRLVRLRRELRALWQLAILAVPLWFGLIVWIQESTSDDSTAWNWADNEAVPGFLVIGCAFVVGMLGMLVLSLVTGVPGRVAAAFVPMASRGREATVEGDADALSGLLPRLRRKRLVSVGLILLFGVFTAVGIFAVTNVVPVYQANHGHGGTVVTIGQNATVSGSQLVGSTSRHGTRHREYFLSTPDGTAIAEDDKPVDGQRWLVRASPLGNAEAYLIGGHDYLLVGGLVLFTAAADAFLLLGMLASARQEYRLRRASGHVPLAYSVRRLAAGARPVLRFDVTRSVALGLPALPQDTDADAISLLRRRRLHAGIAAVVVVGLAVVLVVVIRKVDTPPPPSDREVTLSYLAGTSWDTDVDVFYEDTGSVHDLTVDMLTDGGVGGTPAVGPIWSLVATARDASPGSADPITANVDVVGIGSVPPGKAVAGGIALAKAVADKGAPAPAAVQGLPAGWAGVLTDGAAGSDQRTADVFGSAGGTMVDISVQGTGGDVDLSRRAGELAKAIAHRGITGFAADTSR